MRHLLTLRRERIVPGIPGCRSSGAEVLAEGAVSACWTLGNGHRLTVAINLGPDVVDPRLPEGEPLLAEGDARPGELGPGGFIAHLAA
jgi:maltooligosyltrehalose trehalohydrolase